MHRTLQRAVFLAVTVGVVLAMAAPAFAVYPPYTPDSDSQYLASAGSDTTFFVMREEPSTVQSPLTTQILTARIDPVVSPNATISMFESKEDKVTVLWVDGLQSLPSEYATK